MKLLKVQSLTLVLLLLCSVCISPVMASQHRETTIEDGVHLVKFDDSPTILDSQFYKLESNMDFIVDGNQFYWVRIGSVKAQSLSSNDIAKYLCYGVFLVVGAGVSMYVGSAAVASETTITTVTVITEGGAGGATFINLIQKSPGSVKKIAIDAFSGFATSVIGLISGVCDKIAIYFVAHNYQVVASDGTILLGIEKTNSAGIAELKKTGIDIYQLTHLTKDGLTVKPDVGKSKTNL